MTSVRRKAGNNAGWLEEFSRAYDEGRFSEAITAFEAQKSAPEDITVRASRAYLILGDSASVIKILLGVRTPGRISGERDLLLAEAFARTKDFTSADERLAAAQQTAESLADRELLAEVGYRYVRRYLFEDSPTMARRYLPMAQGGKSAVARLDAVHGETYILSWEGRFKEQAARLVEMLGSIDPASPRFIDHRAAATQTLAVLVRELWLPDCVAEVDRQLGGTWPDDFRAHRFQAAKALGWTKALQGDYFNAFRHLRFASEFAPTKAWNVVSACDRSYLARCVQEPRWARQELDVAESLAEDVEWHSTIGEERIGLLLLAELFAPIDSAKAAMYLARHRELGDIKSPLHRSQDPRLSAFFGYSTAVTELALGNKKRGLSDLRDALDAFERVGYEWRTARCLIAEYAVTAEEALLATAAERLRNYGQSWLARELRSLKSSSRRIDLPPMKRRVFEEACLGKSIPEIAKVLGKSEYTISNHMKEIFKAFNVSSRSQLMAEAARRGLLGGS